MAPGFAEVAAILVVLARAVAKAGLGAEEESVLAAGAGISATGTSVAVSTWSNFLFAALSAVMTVGGFAVGMTLLVDAKVATSSGRAPIAAPDGVIAAVVPAAANVRVAELL